MLSFSLKKKTEEIKAEGYLAVHFDKHGIGIAYRKKIDNNALRPEIDLCGYIPCNSAADRKTNLHTFVKKHHLKHAPTNFILSQDKYRMIYLDAPKVPDEELATAARYLVKDLIKYPLNEAVIDAFRVPTRPGQKEKMYVVTCKFADMQAVAKLLEEVDLSVNCIDIPELALANFISLLERQSDPEHAFSASLAKEKQPAKKEEAVGKEGKEAPASPTLEAQDTQASAPPSEPAGMSGGLMEPQSADTSALAKTEPTRPAEEQKKEEETPQTPETQAASTTPAQAEAVKPKPTTLERKKDEIGILLLQPDFAELSVNRNNLLCLAREIETELSYKKGDAETELGQNILGKLDQEIERSISYYQSHLSQGEMKEFYVLSMLKNQDTLTGSLQELLNADVRALNLNEKVKLPKEMSRNEQAKCIIALGGVLREIREAELGGAHDSTN